MRLTELKPTFLVHEDDNNFRMQDSIEGANGIEFLCPKCFEENKGSVGTHGVICWNPSVPQTTKPNPGRWEMHGTGYNDLTLVAGSSSVLIKAPCEAHFFIRDGEIIGA